MNENKIFIKGFDTMADELKKIHTELEKISGYLAVNKPVCYSDTNICDEDYDEDYEEDYDDCEEDDEFDYIEYEEYRRREFYYELEDGLSDSYRDDVCVDDFNDDDDVRARDFERFKDNDIERYRNLRRCDRFG